MKKRCHCRVFCECWLPYQFLLWLDETAVKWLPSEKRQAVSFLQKHQKPDQICCYNEEKRTSVLSWQVCGCNYTGFTVEKYFFCHQAPIPKFTKICFPAASELCEDTTRTQGDIPSEKRSGERVLWVLTAIPVVTLIRWKCTVTWLTRKKC